MIRNRGRERFSRIGPTCYIKTMGYKCGIVGLPNVGKSTIFNALTGAGAPAENYPFCTTSPHVGVAVPHDERLEELARLLGPERVVPSIVEFVDIAGLVKGASRGEGMGNEFLDNVRNVDAVAHVVRCFEDKSISFHESVSGVDPVRDAEIIEFELLQKDLEWTERRKEKASKLLRTGDKSLKKEIELYERMEAWLNREKPLSAMEYAEEELSILREMGPLTMKPMFYVANLGEEALSGASQYLEALEGHAAKRNSIVIPFHANLEAELAELEEGEREAFRAEMGLSRDGVADLAVAGQESLGLVTFYTKVGPELRAWTVPAGTPAPKAAGAIHTDFERGFIKAEVASFEDFSRAGSEAEARKKGALRQEGKDYLIRDGDVVRFKFNV